MFRNSYVKIIGGAIVVLLCVVLFVVFNKKDSTSTQAVETVIPSSTSSVIGKSVEGRDIEAYSYGNGSKELTFVGGVHGGYEWNSVLLAYRFMDYLKDNPDSIPKNLTINVIPSANPDGLYKIIGKEGRFSETDIPAGLATSPGRFNANAVDLNRNFDCKWQPKSTWQNKTVSAGDKPFSEPESVAIRDFIKNNNPVAVVFWHSQGNAVYASQCEDGIIPETITIMNIFAKASGYKAVPEFDAYETTGDSEAWLAKIGIPAITVELKNHNDIDWIENLAGSLALFEHYKDLGI